MQNRIKEIRKAQGLTLQVLADRVNSSSQHISQLENGRRRLNVDWLERISDALDCHPFELLDGVVVARTAQERTILELFRNLTNEQREAFIGVTKALTRPTEPTL